MKTAKQAKDKSLRNTASKVEEEKIRFEDIINGITENSSSTTVAVDLKYPSAKNDIMDWLIDFGYVVTASGNTLSISWANAN